MIGRFHCQASPAFVTSSGDGTMIVSGQGQGSTDREKKLHHTMIQEQTCSGQKREAMSARRLRFCRRRGHVETCQAEDCRTKKGGGLPRRVPCPLFRSNGSSSSCGNGGTLQTDVEPKWLGGVWLSMLSQLSRQGGLGRKGLKNTLHAWRGGCQQTLLNLL